MGRPRKKNQFKRMNGSQYLYAAYYDEAGERRWKSTGATDEVEANVVVSRWLNSDGEVKPFLNETILMAEQTLADLTIDFFVGEECPFLKRRKLFNNNRKDTSVKTDLNNLKLWILPYWGEKKFSEINARSVEDFLNWLTTTPSSSTKKPLASTAIHNTLGCFRKILRTLFEIQWVPSDKHALIPSYGRKTRNRRTPLEFIEIKQLLFPLLHPRLSQTEEAEATASLINFWDSKPDVHAMLLLCYFSGLRIGEVQALRPSRIKSLESGGHVYYFVKIAETWAESIQTMKPETKTDDTRWVPIPDAVWPFVLAIVLACSKVSIDEEWKQELVLSTDNLLFPSGAGQPISRSVVRKTLLEAIKIAGLNKVTSPHQGRHFFQTYLTGRVDSKLIDLIIGHNLGQIQQTYTTSEKVLEAQIPVSRIVNEFIESTVTLELKSL